MSDKLNRLSVWVLVAVVPAKPSFPGHSFVVGVYYDYNRAIDCRNHCLKMKEYEGVNLRLTNEAIIDS